MHSVGPVVYAVYVKGQQFRDMQFMLDIELRQEFGKHDMFFLRIEYPRRFRVSNMALWPDNTPVQIIWGRRPDLQSWYGYVNHHEIASDADSGTKAFQVTYSLIGTSRALNTAVTKVWKQTSPTYAARKIAQKNGLRSVLTNLSWSMPYEVQAGESDLDFLNRVGDKYGLKLWCSGGTLYYIDPAIALYTGSKTTVPVYYHDKLLTQQDTLRKFDQMAGQNIPGNVVANRAVYGLDHRTGQMFAAVSNPKTNTEINYINTQRHVQTYAEGRKVMQSWQNQSQYWDQAKAQVFGNTTLYPGKLVNFQGNSLPQGQGGFWLVQSARHVLKGSGLGYTVLDRYITDLVVMRNTTGQNVRIKNVAAVNPEFTQCTLNSSNNWTSVSHNVLYNTAVMK